MESEITQEPITLPSALHAKLIDYRRQVWWIKIAEGVLAGLFGLLVSYLLVFLLDRFFDTPAGLRWVILLTGMSVLGLGFPMTLHRWVWSNRRMDQLARLLRGRYPRLSDHLLSVIELVSSEADQNQSATLCRAALKQVDQESTKYDLSDAVPNPKHRRWLWIATLPLLLAIAVMVALPAAGTNALTRWLMPWKETPRYTFTRLHELPEEIVVPFAEPFTFQVSLEDRSRWEPKTGIARYDEHQPVMAKLSKKRQYQFPFASATQATDLHVTVGDAHKKVAVRPENRPEVLAVVAQVTLPAYLQRDKPILRDVRSGFVSLVEDSSVFLKATISRTLAEATLNNKRQSVEGDALTTSSMVVEESQTMALAWRDSLGLTSKQPFVLQLDALADQPPTLLCNNLANVSVLLEEDVLSFEVRAEDDFGIKKIGLEWRAMTGDKSKVPALLGERALSAGGPEQVDLQALATFSAKREGVAPQTLELRAFVEDYLPGRPRVRSTPYLVHVMSAADHLVWIDQQLQSWLQRSEEVYETERQLYEINRQLRHLKPEELDRPATRRKIERQAAAERANALRLAATVRAGENIAKQAAKNDQFQVGHLESLAQMLLQLKNISSTRMPSVADLLKQAKSAKSPQSSPTSPSVSINRNDAQGKGAAKSDKGNSKPKSLSPSLSDVESGFNKSPKEEPSDRKTKGGKSSLGLPSTTLLGGVKKGDKKKHPVATKLDRATEQQAELLAEFEKIRDELRKLLGNIEGSTFIKRLKAASRRQIEIAEDVNRELLDGFGIAENRLKKQQQEQARRARLEERETEQSKIVDTIRYDLHAYLTRKSLAKIKDVLDEMNETRVVTKLDELGNTITKNHTGQTIAGAEFWADTLDRWAENLVDPASGGSCPGCKSRGSLPPSVVLEVMKILDKEIALRDETRSLEQARSVMQEAAYLDGAVELATTQRRLGERTANVIKTIRELPDGESRFSKQLDTLSQAESVMAETAIILARPDTGSPAIGAETESIELLLQAKRANPGSKGSGGSSPGGGSSGTTNQPALALLGDGSDEDAKVVHKQIFQQTGSSGRELPEEFRQGLDTYFSTVEEDSGE